MCALEGSELRRQTFNNMLRLRQNGEIILKNECKLEDFVHCVFRVLMWMGLKRCFGVDAEGRALDCLLGICFLNKNDGVSLWRES